MVITSAYSYLTRPEKGLESQTTIKGASITLEQNDGQMFKMVSAVFNNAHNECTNSIIFLPNEMGEQKNDTLDLILSHIKTESQESGRKLAESLQKVTTNKSGLGLLFIILGATTKGRRIVISRFPADSGILVDEDRSILSITYMEKVFMKNAMSYKCAMYEGRSYDRDFWTGKAIDKQINSSTSISNYWIRDFLQSDFETTGARGTQRFSDALKKVSETTKSLVVKEEINAIVRLLKNSDNKVVSASSIANRYNLSDNTQSEIKQCIGGEQNYKENFKFKVEILNEIIPFRVIELHNGATISAAAQKFDEVFTKKDNKNGQTEFSTVGRIVNDKFRRRK